MMTPEKVFVDAETFKNGLAGAGIVVPKIITPKPSTPGDVEGELISLFTSASDKDKEFFNLVKHFAGMMKSKRDAKDQFKKMFDIFIMSLKSQYPSEDKAEKIEKIQISIETTINEIDNFVKDGNLHNDYFKVGLAALLVKLL